MHACKLLTQACSKDDMSFKRDAPKFNLNRNDVKHLEKILKGTLVEEDTEQTKEDPGQNLE